MEFIFGAIIGIADIIPGVSGGTFALVLGIYHRLLHAVAGWNVQYVKSLLVKLFKGKFKEFFGELFTDDNLFLCKIVVGDVIALLLMSRLMKYLLANHYSPTYGFFFGLILFSLYLPYKMIKNRRNSFIFWLILGLCVTVIISAMVDPSSKILQKSANLQQIFLYGANASGSHAIMEYVSLFLVGMLAISVMVLPGVSGSFILLLFGRYSQIIGAVSRLNRFNPDDIMLLFAFGLGVIFGILLFVRVLNYLFNRFKDQTLYFLIGLMLGSLYAIWPFKACRIADIYSKVDGSVVLLQNQSLMTNKLALPSDVGQLLMTLVFAVLGMLVMLWFIRYEGKQK